MRLVALLFLFPSISHAAGENLGQLITESRVLIMDSTNTTRQRFSDSQITQFINQGQRYTTSDSACLQQSIIFSLTPGTTYYTLPSNFATMLRVTIGQKYIPQQSVAALDGKSRGWEAASGYPSYWFINFTSRTLVGFAPFPQQSSDTDTVKVEFEIQANDLVNSTDLPFNGIAEMQEYNHMLAYYATAIMDSINGQPQSATFYMNLFQDIYKKFKEDCNNTPAYLPSATGSM